MTKMANRKSWQGTAHPGQVSDGMAIQHQCNNNKCEISHSGYENHPSYHRHFPSLAISSLMSFWSGLGKRDITDLTHSLLLFFAWWGTHKRDVWIERDEVYSYEIVSFPVQLPQSKYIIRVNLPLRNMENEPFVSIYKIKYTFERERRCELINSTVNLDNVFPLSLSLMWILIVSFSPYR